MHVEFRYEKMVGAVMTNQYFTTPAVDAAKKLRVLLKIKISF